MKRNNKNSPPAVCEFLLKLFLKEQDSEHRPGDFHEMYEHLLHQEGKFRAVKWYWLQVIRSIPQFLFNNIIWEAAMFKNYIKIALRNLYKTKFYTALNILGLAVGLACCIFIFLYVTGELSYDNFHKNGDNIYRMNWEYNWNGSEGVAPGTPPPLAATMVNEIPGIKASTRIYHVSQMVVRHEDAFFMEDKIFGVDSNFFNIFSFRLIEGNPATALTEPGSVILTEDMAKKYFGTINVLGKTLIIGKDSEFLKRPYSSAFKVTGVVQNPPHNSHIQFDILTSQCSLHYLLRF